MFVIIDSIRLDRYVNLFKESKFILSPRKILNLEMNSVIKNHGKIFRWYFGYLA